MTHYKPRKRKLTLAEIAVAIIVAGLVSGSALQGRELTEKTYVAHVISDAKAFEAAITTFKDTYGALPGDFSGAGTKLKGCTGAGGADCNPWKVAAADGNVGTAHTTHIHSFAVPKTTHVPAQSAEDETILFWQHLYRADLISGVTDDGIKNNITPAFGKTHPAGRHPDTGFTISTMRGANLPYHTGALKGEDMTLWGLTVVLASEAVLNEKATLITEGQQAISPRLAAQIDRKMDDGRPYGGWVKAYGAVGCLHDSTIEPLLSYWFNNMIDGHDFPRGVRHERIKHGNYNEESAEKDCGLTFRIEGLDK